MAQKFKSTYASLGLSVDDVAKLLRVTPRTLHNWNSGRHDIPYSAYKLLRVLLRHELPGDEWVGWHFHRGKLYTPEGYAIAAHESAWWSLLIRKAHMFTTLYAAFHDLQDTRKAGRGVTPADGGVRSASQPQAAQTGPTDAVGRAAKPPGLDLSNKHFRTMSTEKGPSHREAADLLQPPSFVSGRSQKQGHDHEPV
ncbi:VC1465 family Xer recombination activation factor [Hydrogenophaga sp.]|uniref:VC1465 family Xer recombination activation factor n=1 Tax=Hydrogenophaga sp. TaxID=1904254 RepID=UPI0025C278E3|nr:VC1465 family Xer recombination activation factor [Hydrogenophaga sp.]